MAAGRPVIAYAAGGACETVVNRFTGTLFEEQTWEALADTVVRFKPEEFSPEKIQDYAQQFNVNKFRGQIKNLIDDEWQKFKDTQLICRA